MAIITRSPNAKNTIDLRGEGGNAFAIMGSARDLSRQLNRAAGEQVKDPTAIIDEMMSGDYENLIAVFDREFGDYVDLIR